MERVRVDVAVPLPHPNKGNLYVLSANDYFQVASGLRSATSGSVVDALMKSMFGRFGMPETIHSNQGRNCESFVLTTTGKHLGARKTRFTPLQPQSDGLMERFHCTLGQQMAILTAPYQRDWDDHLPLVVKACRSIIQEPTSCTPAVLILWRQLGTPAALAFSQPPGVVDTTAGSK